MVRIETTPNEISLAGNPISFKVWAEKSMTKGQNDYAQTGIRFLSRPTAGQTLTVSIDGVHYAFQVVNAGAGADADNALQIVIPTGEQCTVALIAQAINTHPELAALIRADVAAEFTAQSSGSGSGSSSGSGSASDPGSESDYNPNSVSAPAGAGGGITKSGIHNGPGEENHEVVISVVHLTLTATVLQVVRIGMADSENGSVVKIFNSLLGGEAVHREGYVLHQKVELPDFGADIGTVAQLSLSVNAVRENRNDIGELLHPYFNCALNLPAPAVLTEQPNLLLKYKCRFWETYPGYSGRMVETADFYALPGRKSAMRLALEEQQENFRDAALNGTAFLSHYKGTKTVYPGLPEKLFFIAMPGIAGDIFARTGNVPKRIARYAAPSVPTVYEIDVSPDTISSATNFPDLKEYDIFITRGIAMSPIRTYRIAPQVPANLHAFLFVNEYGVPETAFLKGGKSTALDITRNLLEVKGEEAADQPLKTRLEQKFTVGSGYIPRDEWEWLCEMQRSLQVWELTDNAALACTLTGTKSDTVHEGSLYSHTFEYKYSKSGCLLFNRAERFPYIFDSTFSNIFN